MATLQRTTDEKFTMICNSCKSEKVNFDIRYSTRESVTTTFVEFKCLNVDCSNKWSEGY